MAHAEHDGSIKNVNRKELKKKMFNKHFIFFPFHPPNSSPVRSPVVDCEVVMMNMMYKERFPKVSRLEPV